MRLLELIACIDGEVYGRFETAARLRLQNRDEEDWPVLATALALECPIWTEDPDFFGAGVAAWTADRVELSFSGLGVAALKATGSAPESGGGFFRLGPKNSASPLWERFEIVWGIARPPQTGTTASWNREIGVLVTQ